MKLWNLGACALALLLVACGGDPVVVAERTEGTVRLPLVSSAPDGRTYKLVGAQFSITGPQAVLITDTSADTVQTTLTAGAYTVELTGPWQLERLDAPGTPVAAQLLSPNPLPFIVKKGESSEVRFLFKLPGEGAANVGIVVDSGGWIAGTFQVDALEYPGQPSAFADVVGKSVPYVISFASYTLTKDTYWPVVRVTTGPTTVQFGGPVSEALQRAAASLTGAPFSFELYGNSGGRIDFMPLMFRGPSPTSFEFNLGANSFYGAVDSAGFPLFQSFTIANPEPGTGPVTPAILRDPTDGVRGTTDLNVSP